MDVDLETTGYADASATDGYEIADDLNDIALATGAGFALAATAAGCLIGVGHAEWHFEDAQGNLVYAENGLFDTDYFLDNGDGAYVGIPANSVHMIADNTFAQYGGEMAAGLLVSIVGGAFAFGYASHRWEEENF